MNSTELIDAYKKAEYRVRSNPAFTLKIGVPSPELASLLQEAGYQTAAVITGDNPFSQQRNEDYNHHIRGLLKARLLERGYVIIPTSGVDVSGQWPIEEGYLVFGISVEDARLLGYMFGQNAIVFVGGDDGAIPRLEILFPGLSTP